MNKKIICLLIIIFFSCSTKDEDGLQKTDDILDLDFTNDKKKYTLVIIEAQNKEPYTSTRLKMLETIKKSGLIEGKNLRIIYYDIMNDIKLGKEVLRKVIHFKPNVIFIQGSILARALYESELNNTNAKFIFASVTDPIGENLIAGFDIPPTKNCTGVSYPVPVESRFQFIKEVFPNARKIAILHADMPQSHSYRKWVENLIKSNSNFYQYEIIFRQVPLFTGQLGVEKMVNLMKPIVKELNKKVELFLAGNDQLGISESFVKMVEKYATKPFVPISKEAIMHKWGGVASIFPSTSSIGLQSALMIMKLFKSIPIEKIYPEQPKENGFAFNLKNAKKFNVKIPIKFTLLAGKNIIN